MFDVNVQDALTLPFAPEQIKTRTEKRKRDDGTEFNLPLSYVAHATITARLNHVFGHAWSNEIERWELTGKEAVVLFSITACGVTHKQFGSALVNNESAVGDALKAAASDGLRKCASLFGIGLDLWEPDEAAEPSGNGHQTSVDVEPMTTNQESALRAITARARKEDNVKAVQALVVALDPATRATKERASELIKQYGYKPSDAA